MPGEKLLLERRTRTVGTVEQVFNELQNLRKEDISFHTVKTILRRIPSIGSREKNGDGILHFLARHDTPVSRLATEITLKKFRAYPDIVNERKESPLMVASAANNIPFVKRMHKYNLRNEGQILPNEPQRAFRVNFAKQNYMKQDAEQIALFHGNEKLAEIIGKILRPSDKV